MGALGPEGRGLAAQIQRMPDVVEAGHAATRSSQQADARLGHFARDVVETALKIEWVHAPGQDPCVRLEDDLRAIGGRRADVREGRQRLALAIPLRPGAPVLANL